MKKYHQKLLICVFILFISCSKKEKNSLKEQQPRISINNDTIKKKLSTHEILENKTWSITGEFKDFHNLKATSDGGFVYIQKTSKNNEINLIKIDEQGNKKFESSISVTPNIRINPLLTITNDNKYIILDINDIKLINEKGELEIEKNIGSYISKFKEIKNIYCYDNNDIIIIGDEYLSSECSTTPTIIKLDMEFNITNVQNFSDRYDKSGCHCFDCLDIIINSITKDNNDCFYFTGRKNHSLWCGKLDKNLNIIWESNNIEKSTATTGLTIVYESDDNIFILSDCHQTQNQGYAYYSYLISINSLGNKNWVRTVDGREYEDSNNCMIKIHNFLYIVTMSKEDDGQFHAKTFYDPAHAVLHKVEFDYSKFDPFIKKSSTVLVNGDKLNFKEITSNSKNSFFISGCGLSNKYTQTSVSKFNLDGEKGNRIIKINEQINE